MSEKLNFLKRYGVDVETGIKNTMDEETYNEILDDFFNEIPNNINRLGNFKVQGDMANYAILVHSLKSNARTPEFCSNVIFQCTSKPFVIRFLFCQVFYIFMLCNCM